MKAYNFEPSTFLRKVVEPRLTSLRTPLTMQDLHGHVMDSRALFPDGMYIPGYAARWQEVHRHTQSRADLIRVRLCSRPIGILESMIELGLRAQASLSEAAISSELLCLLEEFGVLHEAIQSAPRLGGVARHECHRRVQRIVVDVVRREQVNLRGKREFQVAALIWEEVGAEIRRQRVLKKSRRVLRRTISQWLKTEGNICRQVYLDLIAPKT